MAAVAHLGDDLAPHRLLGSARAAQPFRNYTLGELSHFLERVAERALVDPEFLDGERARELIGGLLEAALGKLRPAIDGVDRRGDEARLWAMRAAADEGVAALARVAQPVVDELALGVDPEGRGMLRRLDLALDEADRAARARRLLAERLAPFGVDLPATRRVPLNGREGVFDRPLGKRGGRVAGARNRAKAARLAALSERVRVADRSQPGWRARLVAEHAGAFGLHVRTARREVALASRTI